MEILGAGANVCYKSGHRSGQASDELSNYLVEGSRSARRGLGADSQRPDALGAGGTKVNLESQDAVVESGRGVAQHGEVLKVDLRRFHEAQTLGTLDGR